MMCRPKLKSGKHWWPARATAFRGAARDATEENLQARIPGDLLMALSNRRGSRLLTTGNEPANTIIAAGFDSATVRRVLGLVRRAEFKRKQAAPGLKVTDRAFGTGWRMPIAAKVDLVGWNSRDSRSPRSSQQTSANSPADDAGLVHVMQLQTRIAAFPAKCIRSGTATRSGIL